MPLFFPLEIVGFGQIWLNPTRYSQIWLRSLQIWSRSRRIWLVFAGFGRIFLQLQSSSGCSGFEDANLPLDPPISVFENGNPPLTDWTFGSGQNQVVVRQFDRVVGLRSSLDSPTHNSKNKELSNINKKLKTELCDAKRTSQL